MVDLDLEPKSSAQLTALPLHPAAHRLQDLAALCCLLSDLRPLDCIMQ